MSEDDDVERIDWEASSLIKPSLAQYEEAIGEAITAITGTEYKVKVAKFDRTPAWSGAGVLPDAAEIVLRIRTARSGL